MAQSGSFSIGRSKVDQSRGHIGKTDTFDNFTFTILDKPDAYGNNILIFEALSKDERELGNKARIVGSGRVFGGKK